MGKCKVEPKLYILLAVLFFIIPLKWMVAWFVAVCLHELFHFVVVKLYGGNVCAFTLGLSGAKMECDGLSERQYLLSVLAGPIGGFLVILLGRWFPRLAISSWLLSMYNLLPILPLDGGRAMELLLKDKSKHIENIVLIILMALALYTGMFMNFGVLPIVVVATLWLKNRKIPCNGAIDRVQ